MADGHLRPAAQGASLEREGLSLWMEGGLKERQPVVRVFLGEQTAQGLGSVGRDTAPQHMCVCGGCAVRGPRGHALLAEQPLSELRGCQGALSLPH